MRVAKLPMRALSAGTHGADERLGRLLLESEVRHHAAAAVEQHDDGDRLDVVREDRQRLTLAVVVDREVVPRQVGNQPALRVGDGGIDRDGARGGVERRRRRLLGGDRGAEKRGAERGEE